MHSVTIRSLLTECLGRDSLYVHAAVTCTGLKSLVETVRLQTLSRAGMQQLQLDVHFLRPALRRC